MTLANRTTWTRRYESERIIAAARRRADHHATRLTYWQAQLKDAQERAGQERADLGLEGDHVSIQLGTSNYTSILSANEQRIGACKAKVNEHDAKVRDYQRYATFLGQAPDELELTMDDYIFFGLDEAGKSVRREP